MGTIWVLDTETKGTGANMVPLERVLKKPSSTPEPVSVPRRPAPRTEELPKPKEPHQFRVVDVMTRQVPADGVGAREAIVALQQFRSVVDVDVYIWQSESERWRRLTFAERDQLWKLRDTVPVTSRH